MFRAQWHLPLGFFMRPAHLCETWTPAVCTLHVMPRDAHFSVPYTHRLRFTRGVFDPSNLTLADALEPTRGGVARVAFALDSGLAAADPGIGGRIDAYLSTHAKIEHDGQDHLLVPGGEYPKSDPATLEPILRRIETAGLCRRSYLIVVGGGAVLDVAGYAAAIAHRGIRLIRIPSTTLSQDDSGVGVKNGVNHFEKKNFLGSFAVPHAVINDADLLTTLEPRDWRAGFSEAVKVALVKDPAFFGEIEQAAPALATKPGEPHNLAAAEPIIRRSAELHLRHITDGGDPFELTAARPLDFGHWSAHKLEQLSGYDIRHGEAVAIGVALDTVYSSLAGNLPEPEADRVLACLLALGFDLDHPLLDDPRLLEGLDEFREHLGGELTISLLRAIGNAYDTHAIDPALVRESIARLRDFTSP